MKRLLCIMVLALTLLVGSSVFAEGTWTNAGDLNFGRVGSTATLLSDGNVLIAGGHGESYVKTSELYYTSYGFWLKGSDLLEERSEHTATLLNNGKVLIVGGEYSTDKYGSDYKELKSVEIYDPKTDKFTKAADLNQARSGHTATLLQDGKVLVIGGIYNNTRLKTAEVYDPETNIWSKASSMSTARSNHTSAFIQDGKVLVAGGLESNYEYLNTAEIYDPISNTWTAAKNMKTGRACHTATNLEDGRVLVTGGEDSYVTAVARAEIYNPEDNIWTEVKDMKVRRGNHTATLLSDGRVLVAGSLTGGISKSAEIYDPENDSWKEIGSMIKARGGHTATTLNDGKVIFVGGLYDGTNTSTEIFDPNRTLFLESYTEKLNNTVIMRVGSPKAYLGSNEIIVDSTNLSVYPFIKDERTLVPVRFISEGLGAGVNWDGALNKVILTINNKTVSFIIGSKEMSVSEFGGKTKKINLEVAAQIYNERTFIPLRALVEALDKKVFWDDRGLIIISDNNNIFDEASDKDFINEAVNKLSITGAVDFGYPNLDGSKVMQLGYSIRHKSYGNVDISKLNNVITSYGKVLPIKFEKTQEEDVEKSSSRDASYNFENRQGNIYNLIDNKMNLGEYYNTGDTVLLVNSDFLLGRELIKTESLNDVSCNSTIIEKIEKLKNRKVVKSWGKIKFDSNKEIYLVLFEQKGDDCLASLVMVTPDKLVFEDFPAKYDQYSTWRVSDGGEFLYDSFYFPYVFKSNGRIELAVSWFSEEGEGITYYQENGNVFDNVIGAGRYLMPI